MIIVLKNTAILFLFVFVLGIINTQQKHYEESWRDKLIPPEMLAEAKGTSDGRKLFEYLDSLPSETVEEAQKKNVQLHLAVSVFKLLLFPIFGFLIARVNVKRVITSNDVSQRS